MFGLREGVRWTFAGFSTVLLQPVVLFLMSALIVPDDLQEQNAELRMQYFRESRWYFGSMIAVVCVSLARNLVLYGNVPALPNLIAHGLFFTVGVAGLVSRKDLVHKVIAVFSFALYISYIAILFSDLS
jgi:hypothetical protein